MDLTIKKFAGLNDTNSELSATSEGGALIADNVQITKFDLMEARTGFQKSTALDYPSYYTSGPVFENRGWDLPTPLVFIHSKGTTTYYAKYNSPLLRKSPSGFKMLPKLGDLNFKVQEQAPNIDAKMISLASVPYLFSLGRTFGRMQEVVESSAFIDGTYIRNAGIYAPAEITSSDYDSSGIFQVDQMVRYRACFLYKQSNGAEINGAMSPSRQHTFSASNRKCKVDIYFKAGDIDPAELGRFFIQLYRSNTETTTPDDELKLCYQKEVTAEDLAQGFITVIDNASDATLGQYAYTSSAVLGISNNKLPPPESTAQEYFKNCLWLGGSTMEVEPEFTMSLLGVADTTVTPASLTPPWPNTDTVSAKVATDTEAWFGTAAGYVAFHDGATWTTVSGSIGGKVTALFPHLGGVVIFVQLAAGYKVFHYSSAGLIAKVTTADTDFPIAHSPALVGSELYFITPHSTPGEHRLRSLSTSFAVTDLGPLGGSNAIPYTTVDGSMVPDARDIYDDTLVLLIAATNGTDTTLLRYDGGTWTTSYTKNTGGQARLTRLKGVLSKPRPYVLIDGPTSTSNLFLTQNLSQELLPSSIVSTQSGLTGAFEVGGRLILEVAGASPSVPPRVCEMLWWSDFDTAVSLSAGANDQTYCHALYVNSRLYIHHNKLSTTNSSMVTRSYDALEIGDLVSLKISSTYDFRAGATDDYDNNQFAIDTSSPSAAVRIAASAKSLIRIINLKMPGVVAEYASSDTDLPGKIIIKGRSLSNSFWLDIWTDRSGAFSPEMSVGSPARLSPKIAHNELRFSTPYEFSSHPKKNFITLGSAEDKMLTHRAQKNTLFVVKEKSIWAVRGENEQSWYWECIDESTECLSADSVCGVNGSVYMVSNKGIVRITDTGVSLDAQGSSKKFVTLPPGSYKNCKAFAVEKYSWYVLVYLDDTGPSPIGRALIYNVLLDKTFTFTFGESISGGTFVGDRMHFFADFVGAASLAERMIANNNPWHTLCLDEQINFASATPVGDYISLTVAGDYYFKKWLVVGTEIFGGGDDQYRGIITEAIPTPTGADVKIEWEEEPPHLYGLHVYLTFDSTYALSPQYAGASQILKNFQQATLYFQNLPKEEVTLIMGNEKDQVGVPVPSLPANNTDKDNAGKISFGVPGSVGRAIAFRLTIKIKNFKTRWSLNSIVLKLTGGSDK